MLLLHAKDDKTVPYQQTEEMCEAMKAAGCRVEAVCYEQGGHGVNPPAPADSRARTLAFFRTHLQRD